jgi:hypothetical protein
VRRKKNISGRKDEQGIIIVLVAVVMLGVVGAMAALSIDVVTLYTARSEAQLAADSAALAGARVLANSGATSDPSAVTDGLMANAWILAKAVALQVAKQNQVGGANLTAAEVTLPAFPSGTYTNPTVTVTVLKTNLPAFFARIWGSSALAVKASATAEAYNPSGAGTGQAPVAPACAKPWLLPNIDPSSGSAIFDTTSGAILTTTLLGWTTPPAAVPPNHLRLQPACIDCTTLSPPSAGYWQYYPGDQASFPAPTQALPSCNPVLTTAYQESVAGCVQTPIACNGKATIDTSDYTNRNTETAHAVNCLSHAAADEGDKVDRTAAAAPSPPFQFLASDDNPVAVAYPALVGKDVMVSNSLVTVPVFDSSTWPPPTPVQIVGFVQLFLNPDGVSTPTSGPNAGHPKATVINLAGCGTSATGTPILGNGASPVAVRLITPP